MPRTRLTILDGEELHIYSSANSFLGVFSLDSSGNIIVKNGTFPNSAERLRIAPGGKVRLSTTTASQIVTTDSNNDLTSISLLTTALGGTNNSGGTYATGDLLYYNSGTSKFENLADVATGNALISGGVAAAPSWGKIGLTTHTEDKLGIANGGTNNTAFTSTRIIYYDGSKLTDSSNLTWDNTNFYLSVGSNTRIYATTKITDGSGNTILDFPLSYSAQIYWPSSGSVIFKANSSTLFECKNDGTSKIGFFGVTAVARPAAYTQNYSTASRTMPNLTSSAVSTTASTQTTPWGYTTLAQANAIPVAINDLENDIDDIKDVTNQLLDDLQSMGLLQ